MYNYESIIVSIMTNYNDYTDEASLKKRNVFDE